MGDPIRGFDKNRRFLSGKTILGFIKLSI